MSNLEHFSKKCPKCNKIFLLPNKTNKDVKRIILKLQTYQIDEENNVWDHLVNQLTCEDCENNE